MRNGPNGDSGRIGALAQAVYEFPEESIVVISSPKTIVNEWRFVVAAGEVVAGCLYQCGTDKAFDSNYDPAAFQLASEIAALGYEPDPVWVVDICETSDGEYRMLEIGGFSFSDLYACNKLDVVVAVSNVAKLVWQGSYP